MSKPERLRQHHVQDHQVGPPRRDRLDRGGAVGMGVHAPAVARQDEADRLDDVRLVLDQQDMLAHSDISPLGALSGRCRNYRPDAPRCQNLPAPPASSVRKYPGRVREGQRPSRCAAAAATPAAPKARAAPGRRRAGRPGTRFRPAAPGRRRPGSRRGSASPRRRPARRRSPAARRVPPPPRPGTRCGRREACSISPAKRQHRPRQGLEQRPERTGGAEPRHLEPGQRPAEGDGAGGVAPDQAVGPGRQRRGRQADEAAERGAQRRPRTRPPARPDRRRRQAGRAASASGIRSASARACVAQASASALASAPAGRSSGAAAPASTSARWPPRAVSQASNSSCGETCWRRRRPRPRRPDRRPAPRRSAPAAGCPGRGCGGTGRAIRGRGRRYR